ncbi:LPXTG cell wall anchor domain-containing protein, partial [Bacillus pseudomycoides]
GYQSEVQGYDITNTKIKDETGVDPKDPKDPKDPSTDPNTNNDSKVPPTEENDKPTSMLPNTGGTSAEMISIVAGMILFVLGGILFTRQRIK